VTGSARPKRAREPSAPPDLTLVSPAPEKAAAPAAPVAKKVPAAAAPTVATTEDPWRYLHPSRVWPD